MQTKTLKEAYDALTRCNLASTDKRGKFPMGTTKARGDGNVDLVPLRYAMTQDTYDALQELLGAVREHIAKGE